MHPFWLKSHGEVEPSSTGRGQRACAGLSRSSCSRSACPSGVGQQTRSRTPRSPYRGRRCPPSPPAARGTARAGNRRFRRLSALRAHTESPYRMDFHRGARRALNRPKAARTERGRALAKIADSASAMPCLPTLSPIWAAAVGPQERARPRVAASHRE